MKSCNLTANYTGNSSSCPQPCFPNPYEEFFKFAFGSVIYMLIASFVTIVANALLLLVFFFDPLKIFNNATTYFLAGLAIVDIFLAATQEPLYATCFIMGYIKSQDSLTYMHISFANGRVDFGGCHECFVPNSGACGQSPPVELHC